MKTVLVTCAVAVLFVSPGAAQALREGKVVSVGKDVRLAAAQQNPRSSTLLYRHEATTNASFMRIRFSDISAASEAKFVILITGRGGRPLGRIDSSVFLRATSFWTDVLHTDLVRVELAGGSVAADLKFRIDQVVVQETVAVPFDVKDPDQQEPVEKYRSHPQIWKASRAVAKLSYVKDGVSETCTGFLIDVNQLMTNFHCINDVATCASAKIMFGYEELDGTVRREPQLDCEQVVVAEQSLDFAVLKLSGSPGVRWGFIELTRRPPKKDEQAYLIHHSNGYPKQVTRLDCYVKVPVTDGARKDGDLGHECDCVRGASGSPLLGEDYKVIGLHHWGFSFVPQWSDINRAVRMSLIMDRLGR